ARARPCGAEGARALRAIARARARNGAARNRRAPVARARSARADVGIVAAVDRELDAHADRRRSDARAAISVGAIGAGRALRRAIAAERHAAPIAIGVGRARFADVALYAVRLRASGFAAHSRHALRIERAGLR